MVAAPALWSPLGSLCGPAAASERCLTSVRRCSPRNIARAACSGPLAAACLTFFFAMRRMYDARGEGAGALPTRAATGRFARDHGSCKRPCFLFVVGRLPVRAPKALARGPAKVSLSFCHDHLPGLLGVGAIAKPAAPPPRSREQRYLHACMVVQVVASTATAAAVAITHGSARVRAPGELSRPARK